MPWGPEAGFWMLRIQQQQQQQQNILELHIQYSKRQPALGSQPRTEMWQQEQQQQQQLPGSAAEE